MKYNETCNYLLIDSNNNDKYYCQLRGIYLERQINQCSACLKCQRCINQGTNLCNSCRDNFKWAIRPMGTNFQYYKPVCPRGYKDCVNDPAYIKFHDPDWYKELYGDLTPEKAIHIENGCWDRYQLDPNGNYYCYDDEDK